MANEILIFDATASNPDGTNPGTPVEIGPEDDLRLREFTAPAPAQSVQYAGSVNTEGSLPAGRKHENRTIGLTILCMTAAALRSLQGKVGKVAREGGTLKWTLPNAETVIFDLETAETFEPTINKLLYVRTGAFCEVQVTLVARPYGRGTSVQQADRTETTLPALVFTETGIKGDMPATGSLLIDNDSGSLSYLALAWGLRQRHYSSASTAALYYEAEAGTMGAAAAAAGPAGASGGGSNTAFHQNVGTSGDLSFRPGSGFQTHTGGYRVFARVQIPATNTGITQVQLRWATAAGGIDAVENEWVSIVDNAGVTIEAEWLILDLGLVELPVTKVGTQGWLAAFYAKSSVATDDIYYDFVALVPTERYGMMRETSHVLEPAADLYVRHDGVFLESSSSAGYYIRAAYEGDYLTVPPAGAEAKTTQFIVLPLSTGVTGGDNVYRGAGIEDISARLTYTPRYLVVPEP